MTRFVFALAGALMLLLAAGIPQLSPASAGEVVSVAAQPESDVEVGGKVVPDVNVDVGERDRAWYLSPTWIVIAILAVGVLIAIIVAASRGGGGTTVIRD
jgi:hypothetical protein